MRERLTKRDKDGNAVVFNYIKTAGEFKEIVDRLAEYEDAEEQGLIVRLPCKVGDTVYEVFKYPIPQVKETAVDKVVFTAKGIKLKLARNSFYETAVSSIGKTIFFTYAEAEKKLKELKGEEE